MKLETEFRLHLQRQQLESAFSGCTNAAEVEVEPCTWVELLYSPSPFSDNEALLLCQCGDQWLAWVPDYGEILLSRDEFRV